MEKIIAYCDRVEGYVERCGESLEAFTGDRMFQDACCMCVVQIGELTAQLSDDAKAVNPAVPWRVIKDTRNFYVHSYGAIDAAAVWDTLLNDLPVLKSACEEMLK